MKPSSLAFLAALLLAHTLLGADRYYIRMDCCLENPGMKGIKLWGVVDDTDWKAKKEYPPYLFDKLGRAKPAFFAMREALVKKEKP